jgi:putative Mn2+ efflux pump MntP
MELDLLDVQTLRALFLIGLICVMAAAFGYSVGHRDGSREGYTRGRAISRHISQSSKEVK